MEKKWFCRYGLYAFVLLGLSFSLQAQVQEVVVSVEVPIEADNAAAALEKAQAEAFRKAVVSENLSLNLSETDRVKRIKEAPTYIKSFRLVEKKEEAGKLIAKFSCEVLTGLESESAVDSGYEETYAFELSWKPGAKKPSLVEVRRILAEDFQINVDLMKVLSGSWWLEFRTTKNPNSVASSLSARLGPAINIRLVKDPDGIFSQEHNLVQ